MRSVICKSYDDVFDRKLIKLFKSYDENYADGGRRGDFVHVKNVVNAIYFLFKNPLKTEIFNIGAGKPNQKRGTT
jgi:ADP-L-glycero-D-manno-heptose 6-epimerase